MKLSNKIDLYQLIKNFIEINSDSETASRIDAPLRNFQQIRDNLIQTTSYRNDPEALEELIDNANLYISMWSCITKNLPFGVRKVF